MDESNREFRGNGARQLMQLLSLNVSTSDLAKLLTWDEDDKHSNWGRRRTPLHYAARLNCVKTAKLLLENGTDVNVKDGQYSDTPLHVASRADSDKVAILLLENGANIDAVNSHTPCKGDQSFGETPLNCGISQGYIDVPIILLDKGADVNMRGGILGYAPLHNVVDVGLAEILIEKGARVNAISRDNGDTPLHVAARKSKTELAKLLLESGANVNAKNNDKATPLHMTAWIYSQDFPEIAQLLLSNGAEVNAKDKDGATPLHWAARAQSDCAEVAVVLLQNGANIQLTANADNAESIKFDKKMAKLDKRLAKSKAKREKEKISVETSTELESNIEVDDLHGFIALKVDELDMLDDGSEEREEKQVPQVIEKAFKSSNNTPLHLAAWRDSVEVAEVLLMNGANASATNSLGKTPFALAVEYNSTRVARLLREHRIVK